MPTQPSQPKLPPLAVSSRAPSQHRQTRRWHRVVGLVSAFSLTYLLATGLPLQFSAELGLGQSFVQQSWVHYWYGISAPDRAVGSGSVESMGGLMWHSGQAIAQSMVDSELGRRLLGSVEVGAFVVLLTDRALLLLEPESGELERLQPPALAVQLGIQPQASLVIKTASGLYITDDFDRWQAVPTPGGDTGKQPAWAKVQPLTGSALLALQQRYKNRVITHERWLQDLHSGRFFGLVGVWVVTAATALLLVLAVTGLMLWWRSRG